MALRLQLVGYIIRWATYSRGHFKEGVSLTVQDELNRYHLYLPAFFVIFLIIVVSVFKMAEVLLRL
jgi:hypothetical protein